MTLSTLTPINTNISEFSQGFISFLESLNLPSEGILVNLDERYRVIQMFPHVVELISPQSRAVSPYLSKFIAACGAGLFDAALNFLWDETVVHLRNKIINFDLNYFYDTVETDASKRNKLQGEADLVEISEWELIKGCKDIGILSDIGYKHLDYIRDMRNWASAAHPNQNQLSGLQLVTWLETCIKEVIAKEPNSSAVQIKLLLNNIRTQVITYTEAQHIQHQVELLPFDTIKTLLRSLFGMYTDPKINSQIRENIKLIIKKVWDISPDQEKYECGFRYNRFLVNAEVDKKNLAHDFLTLVNGLPFLPESVLAVEIKERVELLYQTHISFNNFYNEPTPAKILAEHVPNTGAIPNSIRKQYIKTLVMAKIGNGYGVSSMAVPYYDQMITKFGEPEYREFSLLLLDEEFSSRLQSSLTAQNFHNLSAYILPLTTNTVTQGILSIIVNAGVAQLKILGKDTRYIQATKI
ncbi:hypothetical protein [Acinetobacter pittii]|uniref:hypothetical protein n=1 Tax=Acinetobacter pittii TaxID=48296 RepID=UPI003017483F